MEKETALAPCLQVFFFFQIHNPMAETRIDIWKMARRNNELESLIVFRRK